MATAGPARCDTADGGGLHVVESLGRPREPIVAVPGVDVSWPATTGGTRMSGGIHTRRSALVWTVLALAALAVAHAAAETLPAEVDRCPFTGRFPIEITISGRLELQLLQKWDIDIATVHGLTVTAYVDDTQLAELRSAGFRAEPIPNQARRAWQEWMEGGREAYHTYESLGAELQQIAADHPDIAQLTSIGRSVQGREIWMMKISDNVAIDEPEPESKFTATIHGNEPVGMELCVYLIRLLVDDYGIDPAHTALVNDLEIWICPLHNPDGYVNGTRYNADGYDLNREFPDPAEDPHDDPTGRPIEVQDMMYFQYGHNSILGINYHTGALVVNYPWDSLYGQYTPDNTMIRNLSLGYSSRNLPMWNNPEFPQGVTIGWDWYVINGGMQDWAYNWRNEAHVTIELSNTSWPSSSQLPQLWSDNREAMLWWVAQARIGVEGFVTDAQDGSPIKATVGVQQIGKDVWGEPQYGYYHRLLEPGTYTLTFSAFGYAPNTQAGVTVLAGSTTRRDVQLARTQWFTVSGTVTETGTGVALGAEVAAHRHDTGELFASVDSDPVTGAYALQVPAWEYDFVATAEDHATATETRVISGPTALDFTLAPVRGLVLLVQDNNPAPNMTGDLAALGYLVTEETISDTSPASWPDYDLLVWSSGSYRNPVQPAAMRAAIESYVAAGGKLLIEGGELGYDALVNPGYPTFAANVLHVAQFSADNAGTLNLRPEQSGHPLATEPNALPQAIQITYDYFADEDALTPRAEATLIYGTQGYPADAGILVYDQSGRAEGQIVFLAFDYNALTSAAVAQDLLENSVAYLSGGSQGMTDLINLAGDAIRLSAPRPSPARHGAVWLLSLRTPASARLVLYDTSGRLVRTLWDGALSAGTHPLSWDGRDGAGREVASGVYFVRLASPAGSRAQQMVVVE